MNREFFEQTPDPQTHFEENYIPESESYDYEIWVRGRPEPERARRVYFKRGDGSRGGLAGWEIYTERKISGNGGGDGAIHLIIPDYMLKESSYKPPLKEGKPEGRKSFMAPPDQPKSKYDQPAY